MNNRRDSLGRYARGQLPEGRMVKCGCGCGGTLQSPDRRGRIRHFLKGHSAKTKGYRMALGYVFVKHPTHPRAAKSGYVQQHILIAENALGHYLPPGSEIHHFNEIPSDNRNSNLVICDSKAYHWLLHSRQKILKAGGDPDKDRLCLYCKTTKPRDQFVKRRDAVCFDCNRANAKRRYLVRQARRETAT